MSNRIAILGDVVTDVTLSQGQDDLKMRLGGISHAARTAWALNVKYDLLYFCPSYLTKSVEDYHCKHGVNKCIKLGEVDGAPYVFLIGDVKEIANQKYEFLLREKISIKQSNDCLSILNNYDDALVISGNFDHTMYLNSELKCRVHIDLSNNIDSVSKIGEFIFETIFISTSSEIFLNECNGNVEILVDLLKRKCKRIVFKENRGGSRVFDFDKEKEYSAPCIFQPIVHSVGVGDSYDFAFISQYTKIGIANAAILSAWISSEYASTTYPDDFKKGVQRAVNVDINTYISLGGCSLYWENRKKHSIYIAAPDFDYIDTRAVDFLCESLIYHNFDPQRPIKENGQISVSDDEFIRYTTYLKDIALIHKCSILIAVYINDDPGTMIELGYAKAINKPCLVYDPYSKAMNCMLTQIPDLISSDLNEIISEVFNKIAGLK